VTDIARLGLKIDGTQIVQATTQLDQFTQAAQRAEASTDSYQRAFTDRLSSSDISRAAEEYDRTFSKTAATVEKVGTASRTAGAGVHRLNNSMVVLARQATGTHPVVGQLADIVGTFAIGTARMVPILAGVAALGFAWRLLTRDAREARVELKRNLDVLRDLSKERLIESQGGAGAIALRTAQAEANRIAAEIRAREVTPGGDLLYDQGAAGVTSAGPLRKQLRELNELIQAGRAEQEDDDRDSRARERRESLRHQQESAAAARAHQDKLRQEAEEHNRIMVGLTLQRLQTEGEVIAAATRERLLQEEASHAKIVEGVETTLDTIKRQRDEQRRAQRDAERELERAQERALASLVQNLQNVGRAYGGVTDQVLALVAAAISLERVPMETPRDRAIGFGSAALAGIGYGASTGDPALGALGGGLSGFAIAGPAGAIVGGVAGIVAGLASSGQRAREAQRVWERAFDDFENMFTEFTALQRAQREIEEGFQALSGGVAFDETAERIARLQSIADAAGQIGDTGLQQRLERQIAQLEELSRAYATNTDRAEELARAEQERFKADLDVRFLRAQGLDEEADALAFRNQQQREYQRAAEQGWDAATLAFLTEVQAAEAAQRAAERAREEWDRVLGVFNAPAGFDISRYSEFYGRGPSEPPAIIDDSDFNIGSVTINVTASDPEGAADAVERRLRGRDLRRGAVR
jgi:hypothetical protein